MKKIILTGGGTAGHVTPNLALVPALQEAGYAITYIGSYEGIEKDLVKKAGLKYYGISSAILIGRISLTRPGLSRVLARPESLSKRSLLISFFQREAL